MVGSKPLVAVHSWVQMQDVLIAGHELWWRSPGGGRSPWAKDGPWALAQREVGDVAGHYSLTLLVNEAGRELIVRKLDTPRPRVPLSAAEVTLRDWIDGQVGAVPKVLERRCVQEATAMLWRGEGRIGWVQLAREIGWRRTPEALEHRYRRGLCEMVCRANGVPVRHARALWARDACLAGREAA